MVSTPAGFTIRCLQSENEVNNEWLDLVVAVFGPLGIPRSYFARHWTSDTDESKRLDAIFVAIEDCSGAMVSTVRVFRRTLSTKANGDTLVGGFGEVSTLPAFRKRGLATALLRTALEYHTDAGLSFSALHAASAADGIYRHLGFSGVANPVHLVGIPAAETPPTSVAEFSLGDDGAWESILARIMPLQAAFVAELDSYRRSKQY